MRWRVLALFFLVACGSESERQQQADAGPPIVPDAQNPDCTHQGFVPEDEIAERDDELGVLFYTASRGQAPQIERLSVDFYFPLGASDQAHEYSLTGESLADCHTCVSARRECSGASCATGRAFLAQSGRLRVTGIGTAGTRLEGSLEDVVLAEITIGAMLETTVVPDGERLCVDQYDFDVEIVAPQ